MHAYPVHLLQQPVLLVPLPRDVFLHLVVITDLVIKMIDRLQQRRHRAPDRLRNLSGQLGREPLGRTLRQSLPKRLANASHRVHQLCPALHQYLPRPYPAQVRLRFPAAVLDRMEQPRLEVHQLRQLVSISRVILVIAGVNVRHLARVGYVDLVPALFDHFGYPTGLPAGLDCYTAPSNRGKITLQIRTLHRQAKGLFVLPRRVENANLAVLVPQIDSNVKGEFLLLARRLARRGRVGVAVLPLHFPGMLFHKSVSFLHLECVPTWELNASRKGDRRSHTISAVKNCRNGCYSSSPRTRR